MRTCSISVLLAVALACPVLADNFDPPTWRGDPLSVQAEWYFTDDFTPDPNNMAPDYYNTTGDGVHDLFDGPTHCHASPEVMWDPLGYAYTGAASGTLDCFLVNFIDDYRDKDIWVQITYKTAVAPVVYEVFAWPSEIDGELVEVVDDELGSRRETWVLHPNPEREYVNISLPPFATLDQLVIDTISTGPEIPTVSEWGLIIMTLLLLTAGTIVFRRWRRPAAA